MFIISFVVFIMIFLLLGLDKLWKGIFLGLSGLILRGCSVILLIFNRRIPQPSWEHQATPNNTVT